MVEDSRRFSVTDAPALAPGQCFITKTGVGPFIDTKVDVSPPGKIDRGRVYISAGAIHEMAEELGFFDKDEETKNQLSEAYDLGYQHAMKESIGGDITRTVTDLRELVGQLTSYMPVDVPSDEPDASISDQPVKPVVLTIVDPADDAQPAKSARGRKSKPRTGQLDGEGTGTGGSKRPNRVSADTGDAANLRI